MPLCHLCQATRQTHKRHKLKYAHRQRTRTQAHWGTLTHTYANSWRIMIQLMSALYFADIYLPVVKLPEKHSLIYLHDKFRGRQNIKSPCPGNYLACLTHSSSLRSWIPMTLCMPYIGGSSNKPPMQVKTLLRPTKIICTTCHKNK